MIHAIEKYPLSHGIGGGILIILLAVASSTIVTIWPQHDIILHPEYWYEPLVPIIIGYFAISSGNIAIDCWTMMKIDLIKTWNAFFELYCFSSLGFLIPYSSKYILFGFIFLEIDIQCLSLDKLVLQSDIYVNVHHFGLSFPDIFRLIIKCFGKDEKLIQIYSHSTFSLLFNRYRLQPIIILNTHCTRYTAMDFRYLPSALWDI